MWKDYFYFTKHQRRGLIVLCSILFILVIFNAFIPTLVKSEDSDFSEIRAQIDAFYVQLERDSIAHAQQNASLEKSKFKVDTVSYNWLLRHGMNSYVAKNLTSYQKKGGLITNGEKFRAIYGMTDSIYDEWHAYLIYTAPQTKKYTKKHASLSTTALKEEAPEFQLDVNTADTAMLTVLYGIGSSYAERIVKYRHALGGYYSIEQLKEVWGMDSIRFANIKPYLMIQDSTLRTLYINTASIKRMKYHPYLNFYQAKAIYEFRKAGNIINNWESLIHVPQLDTVGLRHLAPYLSYHKP